MSPIEAIRYVEQNTVSIKRKKTTMENYLMRDTDVSYNSISTLKADVLGMKNVVLLVGGMIGAVFALVGLINFINLVMTNTIFRRRKIGFIFQNYNLVPVLNVFENIVLPVELDGNKVDKKFMKEVVRMLGLEDKLNNMPSNLSGGQQQRVAIARALVSKPAIVLADEPTGNLDSKTSSDVLGLLKVTSQKFHQTLVMITHNSEIAQLADRIIRIEDGRIMQ
ncbi:ABC transporter ATP-binding protein [uncultured Dysosmobacter sp.]|uniref:ABC transporter ATP-binding protein n=1 Tax=uncultured Dysosmobacter sp. TaxID=2591384 RepID=UPI00262FE0D7|nr:ATP-binding cassette domain-containing protein [uncultured Dysosmobacter sp.]